jgi:hypothetical protein
MNSSDVSPIEAINEAIQSHNPFINAGIVKEQDVWGQEGFRDVPTLNAHASDTVFQAIEMVRTSQSSQEKVTSIAITAAQGVGKTHILSRIRHRLKVNGSALFIYAGANNYTDLNLIKYQFQQTLTDSLGKTGSQGVTQWQEVAAAMANEGFQAIDSNVPNVSPDLLVKRFDKVYASWLSKNKNLMNRLIKEVLKTKPNADPYIVRAILWTLSETQSSFAIKWLSGDELAQSNAEDLGLPNQSKTNQDREAEALKAVQQIINLVSYYNPVVICFDEIDVENNCNPDGLHTPQVIADLVKRLHDTLEQSELGRGVVILTVMMSDTWVNKVDLMQSGIPDIVSKYTQRRPIDLKYIDSDSIIELVTLWLKDFYGEKRLTPPNPLYPFEEIELREYGKNRPTVREALKWCAKNFKVDEGILIQDPFARFEVALKRESEFDRDNYLDDNPLVADALRFGFQTLKSQILDIYDSDTEKVEQVIIEDIVEIEPKIKNQGWINFKVIGKVQDKVFKIGVCVLQHSHGRAVGAGMWRLIEYETFDITQGCLVRSKNQEKKIPNTWDAYGYLKKLLEELDGKHVDLKTEEIRPLIDIYSVYEKRESYQLNDEQIMNFSQQINCKNPLLLEILRNPLSLIDKDIIERQELINDFLNPSSLSDVDEIDDIDDLSELLNV